MKDVFITIAHLQDFNGLSNIRVNDVLTLIKDLDNPYDDEAIAVYDKDDTKVGYVANSVDIVARGTYSAGRIYDLNSLNKCLVCFILEDCIIAKCIK